MRLGLHKVVRTFTTLDKLFTILGNTGLPSLSPGS